MKRPALLAPLTLLASLAAPAAVPAGAAQDRRALAAVERLHAATGGADAPYRCESIAFTFEVEREGKVAASRRHVWSPKTGAHRVAGKGKDGVEFDIEWNLESREGSAKLGGSPVTGEGLRAQLEKAWGLWVNDTYWLLMPYKLRDPGVHLEWDGEVAVDGRACDKVKVTFDKVGLTPGDTYWAYLNQETGRMEGWAFVLQGEKPPPVGWKWLETGRFGPLTLSLRKEAMTGGTVIRFRDVEVR